MEVHHCDNLVLLRLDPKNDSAGERHRKTAANAIFDFMIEERVDLDSVESVLNRREEAFAEILLLALVKPGRRNQLDLGFRMEANRFHPSAA
jgi:hypothetical protein